MMQRFFRWAIIAGVLLGCAGQSVLANSASANSASSDRYVLDLLRSDQNGSRIYVQARLPDDSLGLFLVDTGAAVTALSRTTAERLGLSLQEHYAYVEGLSGRSPYARGVLPTLGLGGLVIRDLEVAVGIRGLPEKTGYMRLDGILGNTVWSQLAMEIDYPADTLVLYPSGFPNMPRKSTPMTYRGGHVYVPIQITTDSEPAYTSERELQVDTGSSELLLSGSSGLAFEHIYTEGVEPIYGIGASEFLPTSMYLQKTRRIPIHHVVLGGKKVSFPFEAKWMNIDTQRTQGPGSLKGLIGHELLANHRVLFDYPSGQFALTKSRRKRRSLNGHQVLLQQDIRTHGQNNVDRGFYRAKMLFALDQTEQATVLLERYIASHPTHGEARVLLAQARRAQGNLQGAWTALAKVTPEQLVEQHEIIGAVNGLLLENRLEQALALADAAVAASPNKPDPHVARADALLASNRLHQANLALLKAAKAVQNPDAQLIRRARVALARGDRYGALARVRRLLQLYPSGGSFLWFYSTLIRTDAEQATFVSDMQAAMSKLHPQQRPFDFLVAAHHALGDRSTARSYMLQGIDRDCTNETGHADQYNCLAWYHALAGVSLDQALAYIDKALLQDQHRSDYLDTKAMVHLARGELHQAHHSAVAAARLNPSDVYMLWQAERIADMVPPQAGPAGSSVSTP